MDVPWFVGDHYLHVQAWEVDFHPHVAKISTTAVWIRLEQLPIEYYHPEFLKHVGNKLGKLLKIDAVTSTAMRGRFARLCMQVNTAYPLPKRVKIGAFWQDIVCENLPMLCYQCGRLGHRESHCTEPNLVLKDTDMPRANLRGDSGLQEPVQNHTPWKTIQTRRPHPCGHQPNTPQRGKPLPRDDPTTNSQANRTDSPKVQVLQNHATGSVCMYSFNTLGDPAGLTCEEVDMHGEIKHSLRPCTPMHSMHALPSSSCPRPSTPAKAITMQPKTHLSHTDIPKSTLTPTSPPHGSLIGPKFIHSHPNQPRPPSHTHPLEQSEPSTHSNHELPYTQPPQTSLGNGSSRIDLEWSLTGTL